MQTLRRNVNPFALMIDPQAVIAQIAASERLERLERRVCRPLDKPLLGSAADGEGADSGDETAGAADALMAGDAREQIAVGLVDQ